MSSNDTWEVFAVKFSAWEGRVARLDVDPRD
jgi:hypothetical protein